MLGSKIRLPCHVLPLNSVEQRLKEMHGIRVALRNKNGNFKIPKFTECLVKFFEKDSNSVTVKCSFENGILVLSESDEGYEFHHSPVCPIKLNADKSDSTEENYKNDGRPDNVRVAASIVIESSDSHILLTKRPPHMRASPNTWVLPGGHLESGETVFEAAARETKEETALDIQTEAATILGLWENVYPSFLGTGIPKNHILIVYLHTFLQESYTEISKKIIPEPEEVNAFCWLNKSVLSKLFSDSGNTSYDGKQFVYENGKVVEKYLDYSSIFNSYLRTQPEPLTGVTFVLRKWLEKVNSEQPQSKY